MELQKERIKLGMTQFITSIMIKKLIVIWVLALSFACSTDSPEEELPAPVQSLEVSLTPSVSEVFVDVPFTVKVQANEGLYEISRIFENRVESITSLNPGTALQAESLNLHFGFGFLGTETVVLEFTSITGKKLTKTLNFNVKRGNAVMIVGFKINAFHNMNGSWDQEYEDTDPNRLADIVFGFRKMRQGHISNEYPAMSPWFLSPVFPNLQLTEFELAHKELYISENSRLELGLIDADEDGTGKDLTMGYRDLGINFRD
ncbi:MAG TPA: hypothetical protein VK941_00550, partial [Gillisia sp.]|nr:hypothetical protein [Gillisia sp.]